MQQALISFLLCLLLVGCGGREDSSAYVATPHTVPKIEPDTLRMPRVEGEGTLSIADFRGKIVLINFFGSQSDENRAEIPELNAIAKDFHERPFQLLGITLDLKPQIYVKDDLRFTPPTFPCATGGKASRQAFPSIRVLPTKWLLDREGRVVKRYEGAVSFTQVRADISELL